jgi:hypothetical protein
MKYTNKFDDAFIAAAERYGAIRLADGSFRFPTLEIALQCLQPFVKQSQLEKCRRSVGIKWSEETE